MNWGAIGSNAGCVAPRQRGPQVQVSTGKRGVVVEWEWQGKKRRLEEAGLRWSQFPNAWQCAGLSPIIHLHPAVSCSAAVLRWRVSLQKCLSRMTPTAATICVGGQLVAKGLAQSHLASRPRGPTNGEGVQDCNTQGWSSSAGQLAAGGIRRGRHAAAAALGGWAGLGAMRLCWLRRSPFCRACESKCKHRRRHRAGAGCLALRTRGHGAQTTINVTWTRRDGRRQGPVT